MVDGQENVELKDGDFTPSQDFLDTFKDTPIDGGDNVFVESGNDKGQDDNSGNSEETPEQKEEKFKAANGGKTQAEVADAQKIIDDKIKADQKTEDDKLAKMTPAEKEKYIAEKNKGADNQQQNSVKPFEEELVSRFKGKYKSVEEIEQALEKPSVEVFANESIKAINDYVKNGGKFDQEYFEAINTDYDAINDGVELAMRYLQATDPNLKDADPEELEFEVRKRYDMDNWSDDGADEVNDIRRVMEKKLQREAPQFRAALKEKQNSLKFIKAVDPKISEQATKDKEANLKKWVEEIVPSLVEKTSKLSTKISDKETFDYTPDATDLNEAVQLMNSLGSNAAKFWEQFYDNEGKFDHSKVLTMLLKARAYDKVIPLVREQGRTAGREEEIRNLKGTDFSSDKRRSSSDASSMNLDEAIYKSVSTHT